MRLCRGHCVLVRLCNHINPLALSLETMVLFMFSHSHFDFVYIFIPPSSDLKTKRRGGDGL